MSLKSNPIKLPQFPSTVKNIKGWAKDKVEDNKKWMDDTVKNVQKAIDDKVEDGKEFVDDAKSINPGKAYSSLTNLGNSGRLYFAGTVKYLAAIEAAASGVGAPAAVGLIASGTWNLFSANSAFERGLQQGKEAISEDYSDATPKNLLGILPFGQHFDDPGEPTIIEFGKDKLKNIIEKKDSVWDPIKEIGTYMW